MRVVFWGTYDKGKPRTRILLRGLKESSVQVLECHADVWGGIEDKSQVSGWAQKLRLIVKGFLHYPGLILRYLGLPKHDVVIIGYMGQIDALVLWPFVKLRGVPLIWDAFLSLYDTVVNDRKIISKKSIAGLLLYGLEWLASRAASVLFVDTRAHAEFFEQLFKLLHRSVEHVYVGAELDVFRPKKMGSEPRGCFTILFYGQFIPLHGIDVIVRAAQITERDSSDVCWIIIGKGQEQSGIDALVRDLKVQSVRRIPWVPYEHLIDYICKADICLGIFGTSGKATRVIPNKVYQILAAGKPLVTGDTPAIRELLRESLTVRLVTPGSPESLASAVLDLRKTMEEPVDRRTCLDEAPVVGYVEVGRQLVELLRTCKNREQAT